MTQPIWITPAGNLGIRPATVPINITFLAEAVSPATSVSYTFLSGTLPAGVAFSNLGLLSGTAIVSKNTPYTFSLRATDNLGRIRDRTFSITISGVSTPQFVTPSGSILNTLDSTWVELTIAYSNPTPNNNIVIDIKEGILPPGLELNEFGILRGYAHPPVNNITAPQVTTIVTEIHNNIFTCDSTAGFFMGRIIIFTGTLFGGVTPGTTYYIKEIFNNTSFSISTTQNGPVYSTTNSTGAMIATLPTLEPGLPIIKTYSFTLRISSLLGNDLAEYSITIINQTTPVSSGGPGILPNSRLPTILNTRPLSFNIRQTDPENFGYYIAPPEFSNQLTIAPANAANIGNIESSKFFAFKILGYDFDDAPITYEFNNLQSFLTGDSQTGWVTGTPPFVGEDINKFQFSVRVIKSIDVGLVSQNFNFSMVIYSNVQGIITWITPSNLGNIFNGTQSNLNVRATSDVELLYRTNSILPPNLSLLPNGDIIGVVPIQPTANILPIGTNTPFTFTIEAYSPIYLTVTSNREFTINVIQRFEEPTDTLYIKAVLSVEDRQILDSLLENGNLIPNSALYRPEDNNFGKATDIIYEHAYGIFASEIGQYLSAITTNHYDRNITLGEIKTAIAKNNQGDVLYEVVYSEIIDDLVTPKGVSIPKSIIWPRVIELPNPPGPVQMLYPNSLNNMRIQVKDVLGQNFDSALLPLWMTSQQENGSTLGYIQAWVICYTKPGFSKIISNNIQNNWVSPTGKKQMLNEIKFQLDRFTVDKSNTYNIERATIDPPSWNYMATPSATPVPNPIDGEDFHVLYPRQTILPKE